MTSRDSPEASDAHQAHAQDGTQSYHNLHDQEPGWNVRPAIWGAFIVIVGVWWILGEIGVLTFN